MSRPLLLRAPMLAALLALLPAPPALADDAPTPAAAPAPASAPAQPNPAPTSTVATTSDPTGSTGPTGGTAVALPQPDRRHELGLGEFVPEALRARGPRGLRLWQWLALPLLLVVCIALGRLLAALTLLVLRPIVRRTKTSWDDLLLERLPGPVTLLWALFAARLCVPALALTSSAAGHVTQALRGGFIVAVFWSLLRTVDLTGEAIRRSPWAQGRAAVASLLPLAMRMAKVALVPLGAIAVMAEFGYPVASLIAGLGIGGLALALAAQKTVENLFGSVSIGLDQPFRVGDYVRLEDGTGGDVETIGLRSTQLRTLDRTVVSIPNGKLADQRVETFGRRDRIRLSLTLGLVHDTPFLSG